MNRFKVVTDTELTSFCDHVRILDGASTTQWPHGVYAALSEFKSPLTQAIAGTLSKLNDAKVSRWYLPGNMSNINDMNLFKLNPSLKTMILPNCISVKSHQFENFSILTNLSIGLINVPEYCFSGCGISYITLPNCISIASGAFANCSAEALSLPNCTYIGYQAFASCGIQELDLPKVSYIGQSAFFRNSACTRISAPEVLYVDNAGFAEITGLKDLYLPKCSIVGDGGFAGTGLVTLSLPELQTIRQFGFAYNSSLTTIYAPKLSFIGYAAFFTDTALETLYANSLLSFDVQACDNCPSMKLAYLDSITNMHQACFGRWATNSMVSSCHLYFKKAPNTGFQHYDQFQNAAISKIYLHCPPSIYSQMYSFWSRYFASGMTLLSDYE